MLFIKVADARVKFPLLGFGNTLPFVSFTTQCEHLLQDTLNRFNQITTIIPKNNFMIFMLDEIDNL